MEMMDIYHPAYTQAAIPNFNGQPHGAPPRQFSYWSNSQIGLYHQDPRQVMMAGRAPLRHSKQNEPKPRLAKDEVEILEREFNKNPKPNSTVKRELAKKMGVELPRINNWFQNRRAKEKQIKKARESESLQASHNKTASSASSSSDDEDQDCHSVVYESPRGVTTAPNVQEITIENQAEHPATPSFPDDKSAHLASEGVQAVPFNMDENGGFERAQFSSSDSPAHGVPLARDALAFLPAQSQADFAGSQSFAMLEVHEMDAFDAFANVEYFHTSAMPGFSPLGQGLSPPAMLSHSASLPTLTTNEPFSKAMLDVYQRSPSSMASSSPTVAAADLRLSTPPPPSDIAARRNLRRPPPLGIPALRSSSMCYGVRTGAEAPRRSDAASPLRRIASATNLSGRIQKSLACPVPRSPFTAERIDRTRSALLQTIQHSGHSSPIFYPLNTTTSSPPALEAPILNHNANQVLREGPMSNHPSEEGQPFPHNTFRGPFFPKDHSVTSPPGTPCLPLDFQDPLFAPPAVGHPTDQVWSFVPQEDGLPTPSMCSGQSSELDFSMAIAGQVPGYVPSQPVTPLFPPSMGPALGGLFGGGGGGSGLEYMLPESYGPDMVSSSTKSSPSQNAKLYQFTPNITPRDFGAKRGA